MSFALPILKEIARPLKGLGPSSKQVLPDIVKDPQTIAVEAAQVKDKAAAEKVITDKAAADKEAKEKATLLAKRRKGISPYRTPGGEAGLLGQAPVQLKTLLGQ